MPAPLPETSNIARDRFLSLPLDAALAAYGEQLAMALPSHIPAEKFRRVVLTAINTNPELAQADRRSLFNACVRAASDGLLPDGREGALVVFRTKTRRQDADGVIREEIVPTVQWMPMYQGLLKRVHQTGAVSTIRAHTVHANDHFFVDLGDEESIIHRPAFPGERGDMIGAYAIATLKDGSVQREIVGLADIERAKSSSRRRGGDKDKDTDTPAWKQWPEQMARKFVIRRLCKYLPSSPELDAALRDETLDVEASDDRPAAAPPPRPTRAAYIAPVTGPQNSAEMPPDAVVNPGAGPQAAAAPAPHDDDDDEADADEEEPPSDYFTLLGVTGHQLAAYATGDKFAAAARQAASKIRYARGLGDFIESNSATIDRLPPDEAATLRADLEQYGANLRAAEATRPSPYRASEG